MRGLTLRGYVTPDGEVLLQYAPPPDLPGHWLADVLRHLAGHDLTISVLDNGPDRPAWVGAAARALEAPRPRSPLALPERQAPP